MVKNIMNNDKEFFQCEECKLHYRDKEIAEECENFCKENHACNLDLIKHSVKINDKNYY